jgi:hypothetical protein
MQPAELGGTPDPTSDKLSLAGSDLKWFDLLKGTLDVKFDPGTNQSGHSDLHSSP